MQTQIHTSVETITPALAALSLEKNTKNRPLSKGTIALYAEAIRRGEWILNGEPIIFDQTGSLTDGQHRLRAVVAAKTPIQSLVVRGVSTEAFKTIDGGKKRGPADVLSINGYKYGTVLAAMARSIIWLNGGKKEATHLATNSSVLAVVEAHPAMQYWAPKFMTAPIRTFMPSAFAAVCVLASERHGQAVVDTFFEKVSTGIGLQRNDPAHVLREKFITKPRGVKFEANIILIYCIKAMNAHLTGQGVGYLRAGKGDAFPALI